MQYKENSESPKEFPDSKGEQEQRKTGGSVVEVQTPDVNVGKETMIYNVVVNHEEQYSIWPAHRENPRGWKNVGESGTKHECLEYIKNVWVDMRPLSLRKKMEQMQKDTSKINDKTVRKDEKKKKKDRRDNLLAFLTIGEHPVEASLRPEKTVMLFKEAVGRGYVHVRFTDTRGGTELGIKLDMEACEFGLADFDQESGFVHLEGDLRLNYVRVRCVADMDLRVLAGTGHLICLDS